MKKQEIISKFCNLSSRVAHAMRDIDGISRARDCFCGNNPLARNLGKNYQFDSSVFQFIEDAVKEKMERCYSKGRIDI